MRITICTTKNNTTAIIPIFRYALFQLRIPEDPVVRVMIDRIGIAYSNQIVENSIGSFIGERSGLPVIPNMKNVGSVPRKR